MSEHKGYYTLQKPGEAELIERKSRFLGFAAPITSEEEALALLGSIKTMHKTATHHCYAYIIGENAGLMRYQDDGEPQGTAGVPILEVLKRNKLVNCLCVVTRYFGGVLLGAGGLVRAYSKAAALAVSAAKIVMAYRSTRVVAVIDYPYWDKVNHALDSQPVCELNRQFASSVTLEATLREGDVADFLTLLSSLTEGSASTTVTEPFYWLWPIETTDG